MIRQAVAVARLIGVAAAVHVGEIEPADGAERAGVGEEFADRGGAAHLHAERVGFLREGVRRRAYWRHNGWVDSALFALVRDDLDVPASIALLHDYVMVHNECVRTGDWQPLADWFTEDAQLAFEGVPVGPFDGREAIAAAYDAQPPDDEVVIFGTEASSDGVVARYGWLREPGEQAGRMVVTQRDGKIEKLIVTFEAD